MRIDHLVYAGRDLEEAAEEVTATLGVAAESGGQHVGLGTRNYLVNLGQGVYLEIIGQDPEQPDPPSPRPFGIDALETPRLVAWAVRTGDIDASVAAARSDGVDLGEPMEMHRTTAAGHVIRWRLTPPAAGVVPFLIEWGDTPHPTASLPEAASLVGLRLETRDRGAVLAVVGALDLDVDVRHGFEERLAATIEVGGSRVVLW